MTSITGITYVWKNIDNNKMYIGYHKTKDIYDGYICSTECEETRKAWSYGRLEQFILYRGDFSVAITLENYLLKKFEAHKNPMFYNKSVGGGVGCVKDFSNLTESVIKEALQWFDTGKVPERRTSKSDIDKNDVLHIKKKIEENMYVVHEEKTSEIYALPRKQVRRNVQENDHVSEIAEKMRDNPKKARENVSPVVILVRQDGSKEIIDGNHTVNAATMAKWTHVPVVYLNFSEFSFKECNVDHFGYSMNHQERVKMTNSTEDIQQAIHNFMVTHEHKFPVGSTAFNEAFMDAYGDIFPSKRKIAAGLKRFEINLETELEIKNNNFKVYTEKELDNIVEDLEIQNQNSAVISVASSACYNSGVGGILNKMGGKGDSCNDGILVVSHRSMNDYRRWGDYKEKLENALKRVHPDVSVRVHLLDPFVSTR